MGRTSRTLGVIAVIGPVVVYFAYVYLYATPAPWWDDHHIALSFLLDYDRADTLEGKIAALFMQYNEHRVFMSHILYVIQRAVLGHVDFIHIIFLGNIAIAGVAATHCFLLRKSQNFFLISFCVSCLMFQLIPLASIYIASAGTAMHFSMIFGYLAILFLSWRGYLWAMLGGLFGLFALYSQANGAFIFPVALALPFLTINAASPHQFSVASNPVIKQGFVKYLLLFQCIGIAGVAFYLYGYSSFEKGESFLAANLYDPLKVVVDFITLIGFGYSYGNHTLAGLLGCLFVVLCAWLVVRGYHKQQPVMVVFVLYLLASILAICLGRDWQKAHPLVDQGRYALLSMHVWIFIAIAYLDLYSEKIVRKPVVIAALCVLLSGAFVTSYVVNTSMVVERCWSKNLLDQRRHVEIIEGRVQNSTIFDVMIQESITKGFYDPHLVLVDKSVPFISDRYACNTLPSI